MGFSIEVKVEGMEKLQRKLEANHTFAPAFRRLLEKMGLFVERQAKENATGRPGPMVQTGRLRSSISHVVDSKGIPEWVKVGTNVKYAPFVELGHMQHVGQFVPPLKKRLVNPRAPAYPFLVPAFEKMKEKIGELVNEFQKVIEERWNS